MPDKPLNALYIIIAVLTSKETIIAIGGGFIGAVVSPWTKWHLRKQELKRDGRKEKIKQWRLFLSDIESTDDLYKSHLYEELVNEVSAKEKKELFEEDETIELCMIGNTPVVKNNHHRLISRLHKVISKKEKDWDLI